MTKHEPRKLEEQACVPCQGGVPPLETRRALALLGELGKPWEINPDGHLLRKYRFDDFVLAMHFANICAHIAEAENHHPVLHVGFGACVVEIWTHKIDGLTESDFYLAAKIEKSFG